MRILAVPAALLLALCLYLPLPRAGEWLHAALRRLYALFLWRATSICKQSSDPFVTLMVMGASTIFLFHILVNIAMTIGLMPVTGLPLPFLSYGGSFALTCMVLVGFLLCLRYQARRR